MDAQRRAHRTLSKVYKDGAGAATPIVIKGHIFEVHGVDRQLNVAPGHGLQPHRRLSQEPNRPSTDFRGRRAEEPRTRVVSVASIVAVRRCPWSTKAISPKCEPEPRRAISSLSPLAESTFMTLTRSHFNDVERVSSLPNCEAVSSQR